MNVINLDSRRIQRINKYSDILKHQTRGNDGTFELNYYVLETPAGAMYKVHDSISPAKALGIIEKLESKK